MECSISLSDVDWMHSIESLADWDFFVFYPVQFSFPTDCFKSSPLYGVLNAVNADEVIAVEIIAWLLSTCGHYAATVHTLNGLSYLLSYASERMNTWKIC